MGGHLLFLLDFPQPCSRPGGLLSFKIGPLSTAFNTFRSIDCWQFLSRAAVFASFPSLYSDDKSCNSCNRLSFVV